MKKQIILVTPGYLSIGILSLSTFLKSVGYETLVLRKDESFWHAIEVEMAKGQCLAIGFTSMTPQIDMVSETSRELKLRYPDVPLIIGGNHATVLPRETLDSSAFDIVVVGEGEMTLLEVIQRLESGTFPTHALGTYERCRDGSILCNQVRSLIEDMAVIPLPNYSMDLVQPGPIIRDRGVQAKRSVWVLVSRGCPYNCAFCSSEAVWHRKLRFFPVANVADWLERLIDDYRLDGVNFLDDELLTNRKFAVQLCNELIKRGLHNRIVWECQARVKSVNDEIIDVIKSAGCRLVRFGLESGSDSVLGFLKNGTSTVEDAYRAVNLCKIHDLHTFGSFIIGSPDESMEDLLKTIRFIEDSGLNSVACFPLVPYPGTKVFQVCKQMGYLEPHLKWSDYLVEKYATDNIPRFVVRNRYFSAEQLYFITRYIDQNVVERLNRGLPKSRGDHRENLERICAGDKDVSNPPFAVRLAYSCENMRDWCGFQYRSLSYIVHLPLSRIWHGVVKRLRSHKRI
jgi:anaerobic magnesium-protoporphyrin IX monomethyl ester cyclase